MPFELVELRINRVQIKRARPVHVVFEFSYSSTLSWGEEPL